jgi:hypothetical protein
VSASPPDHTGRHPDTSCAGQVGGAGFWDSAVLLFSGRFGGQETASITAADLPHRFVIINAKKKKRITNLKKYSYEKIS